MKKFIISLLIFTAVFIPTASAAQYIPDDTECHDIIMNLLAPTINKGIDGYYKNLYNYIPGFEAWNTEIKSIDRPNGNRTQYFIIKLDVKPYFGPHITVGEDLITIELKAFSEPKIIKFEHLKDFELPQNYKNFKKTALRN